MMVCPACEPVYLTWLEPLPPRAPWERARTGERITRGFLHQNNIQASLAAYQGRLADYNTTRKQQLAMIENRCRLEHGGGIALHERKNP